MIDAAKLNALPDEVLFKLKAQIDKAVEIRKYKLLVTGKTATFTCSKTGETIRIMINGRGPKNITGYRIHDDGRHDLRAKWRCHPEFLTPCFEPKKPVAKPLGVGADAPVAMPGW